MNNERFAILIKNQSNLELRVFNSRVDAHLFSGADKSQSFIEGAQIQGNVGVIGRIAFNDTESPKEILRDFSLIYFGGNIKEDFPNFIEYPLRFEPTITHAFVQYFSERTKSKKSSLPQ